MKTDKQIVALLKRKLKKLKSEYEDLYLYYDDYKVKSEWHRLLHDRAIKIYLLEEILGINE